MASNTDIAAPKTTNAQPAPTLSKEEVLRYSRHLIMPEVGMDGQLKLKAAKVLCLGTGVQDDRRDLLVVGARIKLLAEPHGSRSAAREV